MKVATTNKTIWIPALIAIVLGTTGYTQTILTLLLEDLSRYFGAAARLTANAIAGIDKVEAAQIPAADRQKARDELLQISRALSRLRSQQMPLVDDLSQYAKNVREHGFDADRDGGSWRLILSSVRSVSGIVATTMEVVENSKWLQVVWDPGDRLALREVLLGRVSLLDRLSALRAPSTPEELEQLDRTNHHYRDLIASLKELNIALTRATDRLK